MIFGACIAVFCMLAGQRIANADPFVDISDPEDNTSFADEDVIEPKGTCSEIGADKVTIHYENIWEGGSVSFTQTIEVDQAGEWTFPGGSAILQGPGNWTIKVWVTGSPNIFDEHSGVVDEEPE